MNFIGLSLGIIAGALCNTRFKKIVANTAYAKLLIITGALKWYDLPHLHHPLIHFRTYLEYRILSTTSSPSTYLF